MPSNALFYVCEDKSALQGNYQMEYFMKFSEMHTMRVISWVGLQILKSWPSFTQVCAQLYLISLLQFDHCQMIQTEKINHLKVKK